MLALPMIFSNITTPLLGLVDTAVIGHLEHAYYLGGIAVGTMVITLIFWLAGSLRMSTTGIISQALGELNTDKAWDYFWHSLAIAIGASLLILLLQWPIQQIAFSVIGGSEQVQIYGREYFEIRIYSTPATLINLVFLGYFIASQRIKWVVAQLVIINSINIILDLWFVIGLNWGVSGVAIASVIADYCGLILLIIVLKDELKQYINNNLIWRWKLFKQLFSLNKDIFIRSSILQICLAYMTVRGAQLGDIYLAANAILLNLFIFVAYALDGFAYAAESLVGQAYGQLTKKQRQAQIPLQAKQQGTTNKSHWSAINQIVILAGCWSALIGLCFGIGLLFWGNAWVELLTDLPDVLIVVNQYLPWMIGICTIAWLSFLLDGVYIGLTRSKQMRNTMALSGLLFFVFVGLSYQWGNHGLWFAFTGFMLTRGLTLAWDYRKISAQMDIM